MTETQKFTDFWKEEQMSYNSLDAYGGLKLSSEEREYKVGLRLGLVPTSFDLDVNYTYYDRDKTSSEDGFGVGLNYHF